MSRFQSIVAVATNAFPVWVSIASVLALFYPGLFTWFSGNLITIGLGVIMLGMGLTLRVEDFRRVARRPKLILLGVLLQYTVMPLLGWSIAAAMDLPPLFAVGLILVSCCPGGVASNVVSFLALADVPLSVSMTAVSTLFAALLTPSLTAILAGSRIDVPATGLLISTVQVVIVPIVLGVTIQRFLPKVSRRLVPVSPLVSVALITIIVASIIGAGRNEILASGLQLVTAVFALHSGGFLIGYWLARLLTRDRLSCRTISIEVGMQNSGLGVVLARQNFSSPLVAIPSAISSLFHSVIASILAAIWRRSASKYR